MLEVSNLTCARGDRTLFTRLSFSLEDGALLRLEGPNGSGKTSLLRIVCGLVLPMEGAVRWQGADIRSLRDEYWKEVVYVAHSNALKDDLTAGENLTIGAALAGAAIDDDAAVEALARFGIARCASLPVRVLSQGQRRRVALARLLARRGARLWILDEPFIGLDAGATAFLQSLIGDHAAGGGTTLLTTHQEVVIDAPVQQRIELGASL